MNYVTFITSHNSPNECKTLDVLKSLNFNTSYYIVIDDEDTQISRYREIYGNNLLIFNKLKYIEYTDTILTPKSHCSAVYAKNFIEDFCKENNVEAFIILDDDLKSLRFRYLEDEHLKSKKVIDVNKVFSCYVDYMIDCNIDGLCFGIHSMYMGKELLPNSKRFMSNIYFRNGKRKMEWTSTIYDDFNSCICLSNHSYIFLMLPFVQMEFEPQYFQLQNMRSNKFREGGLVELYDNYDSFNRAFISVIINPSGSLTYKNKLVYMMYTVSNKTFPKIISSKYKNIK